MFVLAEWRDGRIVYCECKAELHCKPKQEYLPSCRSRAASLGQHPRCSWELDIPG